MQAKISARQITKRYPVKGQEFTALDRFDLEVGEGEFVCIVGPSGCGKSTFLRILAGLYEPTAGELIIRRSSGLNGGAPKPLNSMIFQEYAIFPWRTVLENVMFGLEMRNVARRERRAIANAYLEKVGIRRYKDRYPYQLSGGMKQRVSIARAFANDPEILLMDEPFGALDEQTKTLLQQELLRMWEEDRKTVVYITHSIEEAILLGDRVAVMTAQPGRNKHQLRVELPRPRDPKIKTTVRFTELCYEVWQALESEVVKSMEID